MKVGDLVKCMINDYPYTGVITKVNKRDLSFYKSHTYMVQFATIDSARWCQNFELEVISESR
jgi:hypothetical protein